MDIVVTDGEWRDVALVYDYELDEAVGDDENDFVLTVFQPDAPRLEKRCLWYADGTEWGGIIDSVRSETDRFGTHVAYSGRSASGILASRVVMPGLSGHYRSDGEANACIRSLIADLGLDGLFSVPDVDSGIEVSHEWGRFDDAWHGLSECLRSSGAKPIIRWGKGGPSISAAPSELHGGEVDSDLLDFDIQRDFRPVNHLVCAGEGELGDRVVVDLYADEAGSVSRTQTLFGADEVAELYDYANADAAKLEEDGRKRLLGYQVQGEVSVSVRDGSAEMDVGDAVTGRENRSGITVTAEVVKKIARVSGGMLSVSYEAGRATARAGAGHRPAGSGSGHAYYPGEGLRLEGYTFIADVTNRTVERIDSDIATARGLAADAMSAASGSVESVAGAWPVTSERDGRAVTVGVASVGVGEANGWFS